MNFHLKPNICGFYLGESFYKCIKLCIVTVGGITLLSSPLLLSSTSYASELRVHDCEGNLRASTEMQDGATKGVKLSLTEEEANSKAKFSKADSESVLELRAKDKALFFGSVESGDWTICKENGQPLAFKSIEFIEGDSEALRVASLTAGAVAVLSGIAIASSDSNKDSNGEPSSIVEPSTPDRTVTEKPASSLESGSTSRPSGEIIVSSRCGNKKPSKLAAISNDCREDEEAPIISPYD